MNNFILKLKKKTIGTTSQILYNLQEIYFMIQTLKLFSYI